MRVKQAYISNSVRFFAKAFLQKYGLFVKYSEFEPLVVFGMYSPEDYKQLNHSAPVILVWGGTDAMNVNEGRATILKQPHIRHIAQSKWISEDLTRWGIPHECLPVTPAIVDLDLAPRGDSIYVYYGAEWAKDFYGYGVAKEVQARTGLNAIFATSKTFNREQLIQAYRDSFIGLRLTKHDGLSVTVVELGMMGRRCIFNGDNPNSIGWHNADDICENVLKEFESRHNDNSGIAAAVKKHLDIGDQWLNV